MSSRSCLPFPHVHAEKINSNPRRGKSFVLVPLKRKISGADVPSVAVPPFLLTIWTGARKRKEKRNKFLEVAHVNFLFLFFFCSFGATAERTHFFFPDKT